MIQTSTTQPTALTFESLVAAIRQAHAVLAQQATKAVNISLTLRINLRSQHEHHY